MGSAVDSGAHGNLENGIKDGVKQAGLKKSQQQRLIQCLLHEGILYFQRNVAHTRSQTITHQLLLCENPSRLVSGCRPVRHEDTKISSAAEDTSARCGGEIQRSTLVRLGTSIRYTVIQLSPCIKGIESSVTPQTKRH